jgi:hypothetical protein
VRTSWLDGVQRCSGTGIGEVGWTNTLRGYDERKD